MSSPGELRERWTPDRAAAAKEALAKRRRKPLERIAFGSHEGRLAPDGPVVVLDTRAVDWADL